MPEELSKYQAKIFADAVLQARRIRAERERQKNNIHIASIIKNGLLAKLRPVIEDMAEALKANGFLAEAQYSIGKYEIDFAFPTKKICVECDGYDDTEEIAGVVEEEIKKDIYLARKGWQVLRFSHQQIQHNIDGCMRKVGNALG